MTAKPDGKTNPFPKDPVVSSGIDKLPQYEASESYRQATTKVERFREDFGSPSGMAMGIRGRFGSGKTHLAFQIFDVFRKAEKPRSKTIHVKTAKSDFLDLYREHFAKNLTSEDLKNVIATHLAELLRVRATESTPKSSETRTMTQMIHDAVREVVAKEPQRVLKLVQDNLLPMRGLDKELTDELKPVASEIEQDFFRAYIQVADRKYGSVALRWLQGDTLSDAEQADLGLSLNAISKSGHARDAMRFLLSAFREAGCVLVFCVDEFERFALRGTDEVKSETAGLLKDLVEIFKETGQFLLISGVTEAWEQLPNDVYARIKPEDIVDAQLSEPEATDLLDAYCQVRKRTVSTLFEEGAVPELYRFSDKNARRILTVANYSFETAIRKEGKQQISKETIKTSVSRALSGKERMNAARALISDAAQQLGFHVLQDGKLGNVEYDFLLRYEERNAVLIQITRSIFSVDEAATARAIVHESRALRESHPGIRLCWVVVGYSSDDIAREVTPVLDRLFDYNEEGLRLEIRAYLQTVREVPPVAPASPDAQQPSYDELIARLQELEERREMDLSAISKRLESIRDRTIAEQEEERGERVGVKFDGALDELKRLLAEEQGLSIQLLSEEQKLRKYLEPEEKFRRMLRFTDEERGQLRRLDMLAESLVERASIRRGISLFDSRITKAEAVWHSVYVEKRHLKRIFRDQIESLESVREDFQERNTLLARMEKDSHVTKPKTLPWGVSSLRVVPRPLLFSILALAALGLFTNTSFVATSYLEEKRFVSEVRAILAGSDRLLVALPPEEWGPTDAAVVESLITRAFDLAKQAASLDHFSPGSPRGIARRLSHFAGSVQALLSCTVAPREQVGGPVCPGQSNMVDEILSQLETSLPRSGFESFLGRYIPNQGFLFWLAFAPLIVLFLTAVPVTLRSLVRSVLRSVKSD